MAHTVLPLILTAREITRAAASVVFGVRGGDDGHGGRLRGHPRRRRGEGAPGARALHQRRRPRDLAEPDEAAVGDPPRAERVAPEHGLDAGDGAVGGEAGVDGGHHHGPAPPPPAREEGKRYLVRQDAEHLVQFREGSVRVRGTNLSASGTSA